VRTIAAEAEMSKRKASGEELGRLERAGSSQVEGAFGSDKRQRTEEVRPLCGMSDSLLQYGASFAVPQWCLLCAAPQTPGLRIICLSHGMQGQGRGV